MDNLGAGINIVENVNITDYANNYDLDWHSENRNKSSVPMMDKKYWSPVKKYELLKKFSEIKINRNANFMNTAR